MSSFFQDLFESIFTPGTTPTLLVATNVTFAALQLVLAAMLAATYSVHFVVLSGLCGGLWWSINWFARELAIHQEQEEEKAKRARQAAPPPITSEESETEVETIARKPRAPKPKPAAPAEVGKSEAVEAVGGQGEVKLRCAPGAATAGETGSQGTKSGVSTEDEWEKVSENEDAKDK